MYVRFIRKKMYTVYILQRNIRFCPYIKHVKNTVATTERKQTNKYYNNLQNKYQWRANKTSDQTIILYCNFMIQYYNPFSFVCIDTWVVCFHWITKQSYRKLLKEKLDNSWDPIWFDWHVFGRNCKSSRMVFVVIIQCLGVVLPEQFKRFKFELRGS